MRFLISLLVVFFWASGAIAQTAVIDRIEIIHKGVFEIRAGSKITELNTPTGEVTKIDEAHLIKATDIVPAQKDLEFGIQYLIAGSPKGEEVSVDIIITYPKGGLINSDTQEVIYESRYTQVKKIGEITYLGYGFDHDWEAVPGTWNFQIWYGGNKLMDANFTVVE